MIKLSELKDDEMILVKAGDNGFVMSKEDYLKEIKEYEGCEVFTTNKYKAVINAKDMIENAIENEYGNMYADWDEEIIENITEDDIKDIQNILDRILSRSTNVAYTENEPIEIDYEI